MIVSSASKQETSRNYRLVISDIIIFISLDDKIQVTDRLISVSISSSSFSYIVLEVHKYSDLYRLLRGLNQAETLVFNQCLFVFCFVELDISGWSELPSSFHSRKKKHLNFKWHSSLFIIYVYFCLFLSNLDTSSGNKRQSDLEQNRNNTVGCFFLPIFQKNHEKYYYFFNFYVIIWKKYE